MLLDSFKTELQSFPTNTFVAIATIDDTTIHFYGYRIVAGNVTEINLRDSLFEIGSITKVFTSTILANEVVNNNLNPTKYINKNFDFKFYKNIKINYLNLSNHPSGLYRMPSNFYVGNKEGKQPYERYTKELFNNYLQNELDLGEKETYNYSNTGMSLLAYSLEKGTKISFDTLLSKNIFQKYDMNKTGYNLIPSFVGYDVSGEPQELWKFNVFKGAGGIVSSVNDLMKFINAHINTEDEVLALTRKNTFKISDEIRIGMALHIIKSSENSILYWHNGGIAGFTSSMTFDVEQKKGVVILSNIFAFHPKTGSIDKYCFELLKTEHLQ
jgi:CubicO group peptidase (beta-lactamase class C family)